MMYVIHVVSKIFRIYIVYRKISITAYASTIKENIDSHPYNNFFFFIEYILLDIHQDLLDR